jgi:hypothetical protein
LCGRNAEPELTPLRASRRGRRLLLWTVKRSTWADLVQPVLIVFVIEQERARDGSVRLDETDLELKSRPFQSQAGLQPIHAANHFAPNHQRLRFVVPWAIDFVTVGAVLQVASDFE